MSFSARSALLVSHKLYQLSFFGFPLFQRDSHPHRTRQPFSVKKKVFSIPNLEGAIETRTEETYTIMKNVATSTGDADFEMIREKRCYFSFWTRRLWYFFSHLRTSYRFNLWRFYIWWDFGGRRTVSFWIFRKFHYNT